MIVLRETGLADPGAQALLAEYLDFRAATFPGPGAYRPASPDPAVFASPGGAFLVATVDGVDAGCGGVRTLSRERHEVKHLWVRPGFRGTGVGRAILTDLERRAAAGGATELVLDTHSSLTEAGVLYRTRGFREVTAYNDNPNATLWFAKTLAP